jgi:hypothetical protein
VTAARIQEYCWDEILLRSEDDIIGDIAEQLDKLASVMGEQFDAFFLPYAQMRPAFDPRLARAALETIGPPALEEQARRGAIGTPKAWEKVTGELASRGLCPSEGLYGLLGAWAVVRRRRRPGRPKNVRLDLALDYVARDLARYVTPGPDEHPDEEFDVDKALEEDLRWAAGGSAQPADAPQDKPKNIQVRPPEDIPVRSGTRFRSQPVSARLCAFVALYLSLPNRQDSEYVDARADPTKHMLPASALRECEKALRNKLAVRQP